MNTDAEKLIKSHICCCVAQLLGNFKKKICHNSDYKCKVFNVNFRPIHDWIMIKVIAKKSFEIPQKNETLENHLL